MEKLEKALEERLAKAKYIKRTGGPGNYKYIYRKGEGPKAAKMQEPGRTRVGKFDQKNYEKLYNDFGFSKEQAKKLAQKGIKASRVQKVINTTENVKLQDVDNLYRYLMGKMGKVEKWEGHKEYQGKLEEGERPKAAKMQGPNRTLSDFGFSKEQTKKLAQKGIKASRVQKVINTTENVKLQDVDNLYRYLMGGMKIPEQAEGRSKYKQELEEGEKKKEPRGY